MGNQGHLSKQARRRRHHSPTPQSQADATMDTITSHLGASNVSNSDAMQLREWLVEVMCRNDGWLRVVPENDGEVVHMFYKFTSGQFKGRYVYARCDCYSLFDGFDWLLRKLAKVDAGRLTPSVDRPYSVQ